VGGRGKTAVIRGLRNEDIEMNVEFDAKIFCDFSLSYIVECPSYL